MTLFYRILIGVFFVSIISSADSFGNHGYPGYCIKTNGDTIRGFFPNYNQWLYNPSKVDFTASASPDVIIITPADYKMFVVDNFDKYVSYNGPRLVNTADAGAAAKNRVNNSNQFDTIVCFLRSIAVADNYEFFVFADRLRANFYYYSPEELPAN